jgi:hypothetical protein
VINARPESSPELRIGSTDEENNVVNTKKNKNKQDTVINGRIEAAKALDNECTEKCRMS